MLSRSSTTTSAGGARRQSASPPAMARRVRPDHRARALDHASTAAQDGTPAAEAAQVVGELPDISVAETTGGTLNMGVSFDATNFDPTQTQDNMSLWVEMQIFSRLVRVNNVGTDIEGDLAESWDVSEDGTEYTFHLRPDAMFGDGSPVTADDVVFSFERAMGEESLIGWTFEAVESVEAVDPATVKITLTAPAAPFANDMALWGASSSPRPRRKRPGTTSACSRWAAGRSCSTGRRASRSPW